MKIEKMFACAGLGGYYFDDLRNIQSGAKQDGFFYPGQPMTEGYKKIRQPSESVSIMFRLEDGQIAYGDCVAIQYMGVVGRDPIFLAERYIPLIKKHVAPKLEGKEIITFREMAEEIDSIQIDGKKIHSSIRYGVTQAILDAVAKSLRKTMAEVIAKEYGTQISKTPVAIYPQSGDERYVNADKMILRKVPVLPQGLFNTIDKIGTKGEKLLDYLRWLRERVIKFGDGSYRPVFHMDTYGRIGVIFNHDIEKMTEYYRRMEDTSRPFQLRVEAPIEAGSKDRTLDIMSRLRASLKQNKIGVELVSDDWCHSLQDIEDFVRAKAVDMVQVKLPDMGGVNNSIQGVLTCKKHGVKTFLGGSCNETDISARVTVHIALATSADQMYGKPGMGVDEGHMITNNEMQRVLALLKQD